MRRLTALLVLVLSFVLSPTVVQTATASEGVTRADVVQIVSSDDPEAAFAALPPAEQEEVRTLVAEDIASSTESGTTVALTTSAAENVGLKPPKSKAGVLTAAVSGCWSHYFYTNWTLYGASIANSWMTLNWCGNNGSITSYSITNVGGSGSGLSYQGNTKSTRNVGWEVRGVTTHSWSFWIGGISKCMQVRGGATGLYSRSVSCSM